MVQIDRILIALAGGGGSSSGGGGGGGSSSSSSSFSSSSGSGSGSVDPISAVIVLIIIVGVWVPIPLFIFRQIKKGQKLQAANFAKKLAEDPNVKLANDTFIQYQHDWSAFNLDSMKTYMTPHYFHHNQLMMRAMELMARQNQVDDIVITDIVFSNHGTSMHQKTPEEIEKDGRFTAAISLSATDITNDTRGGTRTSLFTQRVITTQYYKFARGDTWLLDGVDTDTAEVSLQSRELVDFADKNGYYYSLDWGWLLLPQNGVLFGSGKFGTSDINNHVIGQLSSTGHIKPDDTVFQLYTYAPTPNLAGHGTYLVAQVAVSKDYGDILVRQKDQPDRQRVKDLAMLDTEWREFNDRYELFASDAEKATSFELLNPSYMEKLADAPFVVNIEVVDNILYLYARDVDIKADNYAALLGLLQEAYREMRI
jgi:hypothetical protein